MNPSKLLLEMNPIKVGARASKLSIKQVEEVEFAIRYHYPNIKFSLFTCHTKGDYDQKTSLRDMGKTNFFTYELDQWLKEGKCQIAIHSAKDLPEPIDRTLEVVAITKSLNSEDVIVFHPNQDLSKLSNDLVIATSSINREKNVLLQYPGAKIVDLRGTIEKRLQRVINKEVDGVVIAKVALQRLGYNNLNMVTLKGKTTPLQGSLAILARKGDLEIKEIFSSIDSRQNKKSLYFGLNPKKYYSQGEVIHLPLIEIEPLPIEQLTQIKSWVEKASHLIFTSQTTVTLLLKLLEKSQKEILRRKKIIAVGQSTSRALVKEGLYVNYMANEESQEGLIKLLKNIQFKKSDFILYPKSEGARPKLETYIKLQKLRCKAPNLYRTKSIVLNEKPNLNDYNEIVFTSPSTIKSFFENFMSIPSHLNVICKGAVTKEFLEHQMISSLAAQ